MVWGRMEEMIKNSILESHDYHYEDVSSETRRHNLVDRSKYQYVEGPFCLRLHCSTFKMDV